MSADLTEIPNFQNVTEGSRMATELYRKATDPAMAAPEWEGVITGTALTIIIILTIIGNILVALSVFTSKYLHLVQNYYIVSLAAADMAVAIFVLPFSVVYIILERWVFGIHVCKMWLTMDIMCCTSSILHLCVIALDRYWSIATPIEHARRRTKEHVLGLIAGIWLLSFLISSPPLMGWNDWSAEFDINTPCKLTNDLGYVIYSAMGSFYIPLFVMTIVYIKIYAVMRKRFRQRAFIDTVYPLSMSESFLERSAAGQSGFIQPMMARFPKLKRFLSADGEPPATVALPRSHKREICNATATDPTVIGVLVKQKSTSDIAPQAEEVQIPSTPILDRELTALKGEGNNVDVNGQSIEFRRFTNAAQFRQQKQKVVQQRERRAARTLSVIMGVFVICWLPFFLMYITGPFCGSLCPSIKVQNFLTWLGYINSSLNPIIYTIFNVDYRKAFKRLLGFGEV